MLLNLALIALIGAASFNAALWGSKKVPAWAALPLIVLTTLGGLALPFTQPVVWYGIWPYAWAALVLGAPVLMFYLGRHSYNAS